MADGRSPPWRVFGWEGADPAGLSFAVMLGSGLGACAIYTVAPGLPALHYVFGGVFGAVGLLGSVGLRERVGAPRQEAGPPSPARELRAALAGPVTSLFLGVAGFVATVATELLGLPAAIPALLTFLGWMNLVLAAFHLLPGLPLDGGRVLRALVRLAGGNPSVATRWAAHCGGALGLVLVAAGGLVALCGSVPSGIWPLALGVFLRRGARDALRALDGADTEARV